VVLFIVALIAGPSWFARDESGLAVPLLPVSLLGLITYLLVPLQCLLVVFALRGYRQEWNLEVEQTVGYGV
jgi:hypothetical protein